jgi:hypothetical protein
MEEKTMGTLDFAKAYPRYYDAPEHPEVVNLEPVSYVTITGQGAPGGKLHMAAIEAVHSVAFAIRELCKRLGKEFEVPKLEGLWWFDEDKPATEVPRDEWHWKLMLRVPDFVTQDLLAEAQAVAGQNNTPAGRVVLETLHEGLSVQMMHAGPYDTEPETVAKLFEHMNRGGLEPNGLHHEIYVSDIRTGDPARARTILRYPVKRR